MKILGVFIVVALGLAIGLWWTREAPVSRSTSVSRAAADRAVDQVVDPPARARDAIGPSTTTHPGLELAKRERRTLEPTETDPERRKAQEALLQDLRKFASDVELTDAQWEQLERDLMELAEMEAIGFARTVTTGIAGDTVALSEELGYELEARCAAYMTKKQASELRFRFSGGALVGRVRRQHFVPLMARMMTDG